MAELSPPINIAEHQEIAVPYGNILACFSVNNQDFRKTVLQEAIKQGVEKFIAESFLQNIHFTISPWSEYVEYDTEIPALLKPLTKWATGKPLAFVTKQKNGSIDCHINIEDIVQLINRERPVGNFKPPHSGNLPEVRQLVLQKAIDAVAAHEIQHLIQYMHPKKRAELEKAFTTAKILRKATLVSLISSGIVLISSMNLPVPEHWKIPLISVAGLSIAGSDIGHELIQAYLNRWSPLEGEAYDAMKRLDSIQSFIKVWFEKP